MLLSATYRSLWILASDEGLKNDMAPPNIPTTGSQARASSLHGTNGVVPILSLMGILHQTAPTVHRNLPLLFSRIAMFSICLLSRPRQGAAFLQSLRRRPVPPPAFRRTHQLSSWNVPDYVNIPEDQIEMKFVRSSGAGGQNVNKVSSCVQIRFHVLSASWMPYEVRQRFEQQQARNINKEGMYMTQSQEHRTQTANRKEVMKKLQTAVLDAWPRPVKRKELPVGLSEVAKARRKDEKSRVKKKKESRRPVRLD